MTLPPASAKVLLISFLFTLDTERGHVYEYNKTVGDAARLAGWEARAAVRAAARIADLPPGWELCLGSPVSQPTAGAPGRLVKGWQLLASLVSYLRRQSGERRPTILFLEWFEAAHLLPFTLALARVGRRQLFHIWLVHRLEVGQTGPSWANDFLIRWIMALVGGQVVHFSDSEILVSEMARAGRKAYLLPIPHTAHFAARGARIVDQPGQVIAWLPGEAIPEKGVETVRKLAAQVCPAAAMIQIVASQSSRLMVRPGACQIRLLPDVLPRNDYIAWMQRADLILLPYDPVLFRARTSGIFVEAIAAGKPPVVTDGTWMAHELRQHGLEALILDWDSPTILADLLRVARDPEVAAKLARMQAAYAEYHSVPGYARVIQRVFEETRR